MSATELKTHTAVVPVPEEPTELLPPPTDYKDEAEKAFKDYIEGSKKVGTSEQRMAYAIMVYCHILTHGSPNGVKSVTNYALSNVLKDNAIQNNVLNLFYSKCMDEFKVARPFTSKKQTKGLAVDVIEKANDKAETRSYQMFGRAFQLAYLLARDGVTYMQFDTDKHVFKVKPRLLVKRDIQDTDIGYFGRMSDNDYIHLDGQSIYYTTKTTANSIIPHNTNASVLEYKACNKLPATPRGGRAGGNQTETATETPARDASTATADTFSNIFKNASVEVLANGFAGHLTKLLLVLEEVLFADNNGPVLRKKDITMEQNNLMTASAKRLMDTVTLISQDKGPFAPSEPKAKRTNKAA